MATCDCTSLHNLLDILESSDCVFDDYTLVVLTQWFTLKLTVRIIAIIILIITNYLLLITITFPKLLNCPFHSVAVFAIG